MKKYLPYRELSEREVPVALDAAILAHAAGRCPKARFRRSYLWWSSAAAAVCIAACAGFWVQTAEKSTLNHSELLALGDFSKLDQSSFNISLELAYNGDFSQY